MDHTLEDDACQGSLIEFRDTGAAMRLRASVSPRLGGNPMGFPGARPVGDSSAVLARRHAFFSVPDFPPYCGKSSVMSNHCAL